MRFRLAAPATVAILAMLAGCQPSGTGSASLDTDQQKSSYAVGLNVGRNLQAAQGLLDMAAFSRGVEDAMTGADPAMEPADLQTALEGLNTRINDKRQAAAEENKSAGDAYLAQNAEKEGVTTTDSGLQYEVLQEGEGEHPGPDDQVTVNYRGTLIDGTEFDSSYERGEPAQFQVGGVIQGFAEGLQLMQPGAKYRFVIPSDLAYGPGGSGGTIGPNQTLIFEVELISID